MSKCWKGGAWWASEVKPDDSVLSGAQHCKQLRLGGRRAEPVEICAPDPAVLCAVHPVLCTSWCVLCTLLGCVHCKLLCAVLRGLYAIQCAERRCANQTQLLHKGASSCCTPTPPPLFCTSGNRAILQLCSALWWLTDRPA